MMAPGTRVAYFRQRIMMARGASATAVACQEMVLAASANARIRWKKSPGTWSMRKPKRSRICVLAMRMAMPLVKPTMTGRGKYFIAVPMPATPRRTSTQVPAKEALAAVLVYDPGKHADERARRAADLRFGAAESRNDEAGDDGAIDSGLRRYAGRDGKGHGEREGH